MLEIKSLDAGYKQMHILKGISFKVKSGSIVLIMGPNGSGKSTILKSIFNLCDIYSGSISWNHQDTTKVPTHKKIMQKIAYVPQGRKVFQNLTVHENLKVAALAIYEQERVDAKIENIYRQFPFLKAKMNLRAQLLSGGQQQILSIARALIQKPKLLLLDEPSLGLSPRAMQEIFSIIQSIKAKGVTVVLVEQNAQAAVEIADKTFVLEDGKIVLSGGREVMNNSKIKNIYFAGAKIN